MWSDIKIIMFCFFKNILDKYDVKGLIYYYIDINIG